MVFQMDFIKFEELHIWDCFHAYFWILSNALPISIKRIILFFYHSTILVNCTGLWGFFFWSQFCIHRINHTWAWCIIIFEYCWIQFDSILLWIFVSVFMMEDLSFFFFFSCSILIDCGVRVKLHVSSPFLKEFVYG